MTQSAGMPRVGSGHGEATFYAMERRETYATTGPRMLVRLFGGYDFTDADAQTREPAVAGYAKGVPMGGDLASAPEGKAPSFLVAALKDPIGANTAVPTFVMMGSRVRVTQAAPNPTTKSDAWGPADEVTRQAICKFSSTSGELSIRRTSRMSRSSILDPRSVNAIRGNDRRL
jgi:hypothetical protein